MVLTLCALIDRTLYSQATLPLLTAGPTRATTSIVAGSTKSSSSSIDLVVIGASNTPRRWSIHRWAGRRSTRPPAAHDGLHAARRTTVGRSRRYGADDETPMVGPIARDRDGPCERVSFLLTRTSPSAIAAMSAEMLPAPLFGPFSIR